MKRRKRTAAVALAIELAVAGSTASFAANDKDLIEGNYGGVTDGEARSILTRTIKITNIRMKVPTAANFDIGPNVTVAANAAVTTNNNQIIAQTSNYTITDASKVPLVVGTIGVRTKTSATEDTPTLVNTLNGPTERNVMLTISESGDSIKYPSAAADNIRKWMTTTIVTIDSLYQVASTAGDNTPAPGGTLSMTLYGATGAGWKNGDNFQVVPTFTIAPQNS